MSTPSAISGLISVAFAEYTLEGDPVCASVVVSAPLRSCIFMSVLAPALPFADTSPCALAYTNLLVTEIGIDDTCWELQKGRES